MSFGMDRNFYQYNYCQEVSRAKTKATRKVSFRSDQIDDGLNLEKSAAKVWGNDGGSTREYDRNNWNKLACGPDQNYAVQ